MPDTTKSSETETAAKAKATTESAKATAAKAEEAPSEVPFTASAAVAQDQTLHSIEVAGTAMFEGLSKAQKEISEFVSERIRQDFEAQSEFLRCRTIDDVREVQTKFFKTAMDQYSAEATRLMEIGAEMMSQSLPRDR